MTDSTVAQKSQWLIDIGHQWDKIDTLVGGTEAMRGAGVKFLPKWPLEDPQSYDFRRRTTTLFNVFGRTVGNFAGKPFKEAITLTGVPEIVESWLPNIDLAGRNLDVFAQDVFTAGVMYGMTHVLADYPTVGGAQTLADEKASGARPYLVHIKPTQLLGWRSTKVSGVETLTQLRFVESVTIDDGAFATKTIDQVRVLELGAWSIYRQNEKNEWVLFDSGTTSRADIPLTTYYTLREGFMQASPPLLDIADLNIEHWQSSSDQFNVLHTARVPILALIGVNDEDKIVIGSKAALNLPLGAKAEWVEHSGRAIDAGRQSLLDLEDRMRSLGAEILVKGPGRVTATQASLETSQQQSYLAAQVSQFEDFLDQVLVSMASWVNVDVTDAHVSVFNDFAIADFDNTALTLLLNAVNAGRVSDETFFWEMQRRGIISPDLNWEDEQAKIADQPPSGAPQKAVQDPNPDALDSASGAPPPGADQ